MSSGARLAGGGPAPVLEGGMDPVVWDVPWSPMACEGGWAG